MQSVLKIKLRVGFFIGSSWMTYLTLALRWACYEKSDKIIPYSCNKQMKEYCRQARWYEWYYERGAYFELRKAILERQKS